MNLLKALATIRIIGDRPRFPANPQNAADWKALVDLAEQRMPTAKQSGKDISVDSCGGL